MRAREPLLSCENTCMPVLCCYFAATRVHFVHRSRESHIARWEKSFPLSRRSSRRRSDCASHIALYVRSRSTLTMSPNDVIMNEELRMLIAECRSRGRIWMIKDLPCTCRKSCDMMLERGRNHESLVVESRPGHTNTLVCT